MKINNKIIYIVIIAIIIVGIITYATKNFNMELIYSNRAQMVISDEKELDINRVVEIAKEVLTERKVSVRKVDKFSNSIEIVAAYISEEEKEAIVAKINENFETEISKDSIVIQTIANTRLIDIIKPYLIPSLISFGVVLVYFLIIYHKLGLLKVLLLSCLIPIISELILFSIIAIARIPFGRITSAIAIGVYSISIIGLTYKFQSIKENLKLENKKGE